MPRFFKPKPGRFMGRAAMCDRVLLPADPPEKPAAFASDGEIKNAVLNAAGRALTRGAKEKVTMADFEEAVRLETGGK